MNSQRLRSILAFQAKPADFYPAFGVGDTIRVHCLLVDLKKKRIQVFQGVVIAITGSLNTKAFLVRKTSSGFAIEKQFFYNSPLVTKVEVVEKGKVRRAKIYYVRDLKGKSAKIKKVAPLSKPLKPTS